MLVVFNFKNQMSIKQQLELLEKFNQPMSKQHQLIIAPIIPDYNVYHFDIAVQNLSIKGRNVGDLSPQHLKHYNINYAFVGHLERQKYLNETTRMIRSKIDNALQKDIIPIICVGNHENPIFECATYLDDLDLHDKHIIVAYEILSATLKGKKDYSFTEVEESFQDLKDHLDNLSVKFGFTYQLIFGGGVNREDIEQILTIGFDGILIGDRIERIFKLASNLFFERYYII
ncbi:MULTISPECIES: triose-phosphate isomerase [Streptococcus]|uniref:triose-phosphate isomerase n=1 Tax=Streptococcus TaxID=1301 RepID=UPI0008A93210|nr:MULTISPECIES: triose-phosphate isomerase [Streptococcus]MCW0934954.1 triose-phosphate isomerase [Streptococcus anginosus]MCW1063071.1 triose-phosphate isomerase [Streptococcus anginosus]MED5768931.1 triose-phosphate isomerase [Streptococcus anginosus]MED5888968.1 triose-phosphate isomerase [Streptococcus anginosus]MED5975911.1 triose-phosphate isomerase [Streptococcus anginosus]